MLVGFFACLYYSALRPEKASMLRRHNLDLPLAGGWGWLTLEASAAEVDKQWTNSGSRCDERELKHRAAGESRRVPSPPPLTRILLDHLATFGTDHEGRLFRGERGHHLARPYDLRHAAVSTWLNGGVAPAQVAEWAGHSVEVLLRVYAKCLEDGERAALRRLGEALGAAEDPG